MTFDPFVVCLLVLATAIAFLAGGREDGFRLASLVGFFGAVFLLLLWMFNDAFPFLAGGDDRDYFEASKTLFRDLGDWVDLGKYEHEQPGYPLLLAWVHQFSGDSLYARKALNVFFLLLIAVAWFLTGRELGGSRLGIIDAFGVLLATPLWFYWAFLLKDMTIALLQSVFVLGLVRLACGRGRWSGYSLVVLSTVALVPFRSALVLLNVAVALAYFVLDRRAGGLAVGRMTRAALVTIFALGAGLVASQPGAVEKLGIRSADRWLTADGIRAQSRFGDQLRPPTFYNPAMFPVLYLIGETDALNPAAWHRFDRSLLRPLSMLPWIYVGIPLFILGALAIVKRAPRSDVVAVQRSYADGKASQAVYRHVLLPFVLAYAALAWLSGSTTRWTLPALPVMVAIAGLAYATLTATSRVVLLVAWALLFTAAVAFYYAVMK